MSVHVYAYMCMYCWSIERKGLSMNVHMCMYESVNVYICTYLYCICLFMYVYVYVWVCKCIYLYIFILYLLVLWRLWLWTPLSQCLSAACKTMWVPILGAGWLWAWFQPSTRKKLLGWVTTAWPTWNCTPTHCPDAPVPQCPSGGMEYAECR